MLCLQQAAAWTPAKPRPSLIPHTEVTPLHVYITAKAGSGTLVLLIKYPETCESLSAST